MHPVVAEIVMIFQGQSRPLRRQHRAHQCLRGINGGTRLEVVIEQFRIAVALPSGLGVLSLG